MTTTEEIQALVEQILGETIDDDLFLLLANIAKDSREEMRSFCFLDKVNSSNTSTTSPITLPSDLRSVRKIMVGDQLLAPIKFDEQHLYRNSSNFYFLDRSANTLNLTNTVSGKTVYIYYIKTTPEITSVVTPVWPSRFWPLIAFDVVVMQQAGIDADSEFARMAVQNDKKAEQLWRAFIAWDNLQQINSQGNRVGVQNSEPTIDLASM